VGLERPSAINCDGIHTVAQAALTGPVGAIGDDIMRKVCSAINHALGC
jgi:mRNA-degrading endonuclease toxin of MazEF toxin-antitoxin module